MPMEWEFGREFPGFIQEQSHLGIRDLGEIYIALADGVELLRDQQSDKIVQLRGEFPESRGRSSGHGDNQGCRLLFLDGLNGCANRGAGRDAVIHKDHFPAAEAEGIAVTAISILTAIEFMFLRGGHVIDDVGGDAEFIDDSLIQDLDASGGDRPHREFATIGDAEFANEKDVQRDAELTSNFEAHGHAAPGQGKDDDFRVMGILEEVGGELATSIHAVLKAMFHGTSLGEDADP